VSVPVSNLIGSCRRFLRDWPDQDNLTAAVASTSVTSFTVADATRYTVNTAVEIDQEAMIVRAASGTTVTVQRGAYGSTAATHAIGASILIRPEFFTQDYLDALNGAQQATFPAIYMDSIDESLVGSGSSYEYTLPFLANTYNGDSIVMPRIYEVSVKISSGQQFLPLGSGEWTVLRGSSPKLRLRTLTYQGGSIRLRGYAPFPDFAASGSLNSQFPPQAVQLLVEMAASRLMASSETARLRNDGGALDQRDAAWRPGSAMNAATQLEGRFLRRLAQVAMPPMRPHVVTHV
jgi:hypothetical protein